MLKFRWEQGFQPTYKTKLSVGADLRASKKMEIPPLSMRKIPLGIWVTEANEIYDIQIRARSSLFSRFGCILTNGIGTGDTDFRDEIWTPVYNLHSYNLVTIPKDTPIVQMVLFDQRGLVCHPEFSRLDEDRIGGDGSTDRNREGREL